MSFKVITESSCDLSQMRANAFGIKIIPFSVSLDGADPVPENTLKTEQFYGELRGGKMAKTSALNIAEYTECFEEELKKGNDILHIGLSSGLSASFGCACLAAEELKEKYPERQIVNIDSIGGSLGQGLLAQLCAERAKKGEPLSNVALFAERIKHKITHRFTVGDLQFLKNGGRISPTVAVVGALLNIKPMLTATGEGKLLVCEKVRGRAAAINNLFDAYESVHDVRYKHPPIFISHADCKDDAKRLKEMLKEKHPECEVYINSIGALMGAHAGPDTLAIFFIGEER